MAEQRMTNSNKSNALLNQIQGLIQVYTTEQEEECEKLITNAAASLDARANDILSQFLVLALYPVMNIFSLLSLTSVYSSKSLVTSYLN
jgi:ABC-type transport system involved in cytochrome bd biosynthesis fused ATPase/permease subunit